MGCEKKRHRVVSSVEALGLGAEYVVQGSSMASRDWMNVHVSIFIQPCAQLHVWSIQRNYCSLHGHYTN
jgi:hypothetical protein